KRRLTTGARRGLSSRQRQLGFQSRSLSGAGVDRQRAAQTLDPLFHAEQTQTFGGHRVKTFPVVLHADIEFAAGLADMHPGVRRRGMSSRIVEGFLYDAVYTSLVLVRQFLGNRIRSDFHLHIAAPGYLPGLPF